MICCQLQTITIIFLHEQIKYLLKNNAHCCTLFLYDVGIAFIDIAILSPTAINVKRHWWRVPESQQEGTPR